MSLSSLSLGMTRQVTQIHLCGSVSVSVVSVVSGSGTTCCHKYNTKVSTYYNNTVGKHHAPYFRIASQRKIKSQKCFLMVLEIYLILVFYCDSPRKLKLVQNIPHFIVCHTQGSYLLIYLMVEIIFLEIQITPNTPDKVLYHKCNSCISNCKDIGSRDQTSLRFDQRCTVSLAC